MLNLFNLCQQQSTNIERLIIQIHQLAIKVPAIIQGHWNVKCIPNVTIDGRVRRSLLCAAVGLLLLSLLGSRDVIDLGDDEARQVGRLRHDVTLPVSKWRHCCTSEWPSNKSRPRLPNGLCILQILWRAAGRVPKSPAPRYLGLFIAQRAPDFRVCWRRWLRRGC